MAQKQKGCLQYGDSGRSVAKLQKLLVKAGYYIGDRAKTGRVSGEFGSKTKHAVMVFQRSQGFEGHGRAGIKTIRALRKAASIRERLRRWRVGRKVPKAFKRVDVINFLPWHKTRRWAKRDVRRVEKLVVHHTGGMGTLQSDNWFHTHSDYVTQGGAAHLCYARYIGRDGTIYLTNRLTDIVWNCDAGKNAITVGIACRGVNPTKAQLAALAYELERLRGECPGARLKTDVLGHMEVKSTSCPGPALMAWVRNYRK